MRNETIRVYKELGVNDKSIILLCPILKVLQMRHNTLDRSHAKQVVADFLKS